jgi:hypothetical protein
MKEPAPGKRLYKRDYGMGGERAKIHKNTKI